MLISRDIGNELFALLGEYPVVTILGPRQAGKTTLAKTILNDYSYSNLEEPEIREVAKHDPKAFLAQFQDRVIIDEIQRVPELLSYIQVEVDANPGNGRFVLTGSFHVSTADYIRLGASDDFFHSDPPEVEMLFTSVPTAFGFLDVPDAGVLLHDADLSVPESNTLSLVGGYIDLRGGSSDIEAFSGQVNLVSVASAGEARFDTSDGNNDLDTSSFSELGEIVLKGFGVKVSGDLGGRIFIRGNNLYLSEGSDLFADTEEGSPGELGRGIDIEVNGDIKLLDNSSITLNTYGAGNGGFGKISARNIILDAKNGSGTGFIGQSRPGAVGNGGGFDITVEKHLQILNGGIISVGTFSSGNGGSVTLDAGNLTIDRQDSSLFTGISSQANSSSTGGNGGELDITVDEHLQILNGGDISVSTFSSGNGGSVTLDAGNLTIDRQGSSRFTGINSQADLDSTGNGGELDITANNQLAILNGGVISSSTESTGQAGSIVIGGGDLLLENGGKVLSSSSNVSSPVDDVPDAGSINITMTGDIKLNRGSEIATSSELSNAGTIQLSADGNIEVDSSEISIRAGQGIFEGEV